MGNFSGDIAFRFLKYRETAPSFGGSIFPEPLQSTKRPTNEVEAQYQALEETKDRVEEEDK